jgi:hypothetical protein
VRLVEDFIAVIREEPQASSATLLEDALPGHQIGFAADLSMRERRMVEI